ncbi:MAG: PQQ-dependent sugar dehydrogenase, partial [Planctomycetia bacterium]
AAPTALTVVRAFPSLSFTRPLYLCSAPGVPGEVFVVEQDGRILVVPRRDNAQPAEVRTFLDLRASVGGPVSRSHGEEGLLGLAFDPAYATNRTFYVHYSAAGPRRGVLARFRASAGSLVQADPASAQAVLEVEQPWGNHNGGWIGFGPDAMLYMALGDGGSGGDPGNRSQDLGQLLGKVLRLNVTGKATYAVPADNPFVGVAGARGEVWCLGLRNPWRCSFDRLTGELWTGDVGQVAREEVDRLVRGGNYGWRVYEGTLAYNNPSSLPASQFVAPAHEYPRDQGVSITGGYAYRGPSLCCLTGAYIYGDYGSGKVWALVHDGTQAVSNTLLGQVPGLSSFGEDELGELYAVSLAGGIYRFEDGGVPAGAPWPARLSQTGLFVNLPALLPHPGLVPYAPNAPFWSDGALKQRWVAVPDGKQVTFSATGEWEFPVGTVLVKHFDLELTPGNAATRRRLETRVMVREDTGWAARTYRWDDAQADATLVESAQQATFTLQDAAAPGGTRQLTWEFPSPGDCMRCHTPAAGYVLGLETAQLNGTLDYAGTEANQLTTWNHIGLFDRDIGPASAYGALPSPYGVQGTLAARARAWLATNCAQCHLPGGPSASGMDLRHGTASPAMNAVGVRPSQGDLGLADAWRIKAGDRNASVLWLRMTRTDAQGMPPLGHQAVDAAGAALVGDWIDSGAP